MSPMVGSYAPKLEIQSFTAAPEEVKLTLINNALVGISTLIKTNKLFTNFAGTIWDVMPRRLQRYVHLYR